MSKEKKMYSIPFGIFIDVLFNNDNETPRDTKGKKCNIKYRDREFNSILILKLKTKMLSSAEQLV